MEDPISLPSVRSLIIIPATYLTLMGVIQYKRKEEAGLTLSVGFRSSSRFTQNLVAFEFFVSWLVICPPAPERLSAQHDRLMNVRRPELRGRFGRNPDFHTFFSVPESRIVGVQRDMVGYLSHWSNIVALITDKLVTEDCDGIVNHQSSIINRRSSIHSLFPHPQELFTVFPASKKDCYTHPYYWPPSSQDSNSNICD